MPTGVDSHIELGSGHATEFCDFCVELVQAISSPDVGESWYDIVRPIRSECTFCEQLTESFKHAPHWEYTPETAGQVRIYCRKSWIQAEAGLCCMVTIRHGFNSPIFAVWADEGTSACQAFVTRPPILGPHVDEAHSLARDWLNECEWSHKTCVYTKEGTLPTRVLQISGEMEALEVRLIETGGMTTAKYCALSHCWGPVDKQPLRTTRTTCPCHLHGIPLHQLPKTFKESILLTRSLNIKYIWIDSLCIIQDDAADWHFEAGKMADVYRNATLVISASDAKDSTEGLFVTEREHKTVTTVPYIAEGVVQGTFKIAQLPAYESGPSLSHLNTRGWTFQERLLARRMIFFGREGVSWKCSELEAWERSSYRDLGLYESDSWLSLLEEYSKKALTHVGDRLHALQGIVGMHQETREDHYHSLYGVWDNDLYKQLLWRQNEEPLEADALKLPTWTWAATGGTKGWGLHLAGVGSLTSLPRVLQISNSGALLSSGYISQGPLTLRSLASGYWFGALPRTLSFQNAFLERLILDEGPQNRYYRTFTIEGPSAILGIAVFDREPSSTAKCFFVARHDRHQTYVCGHARPRETAHARPLIKGDMSSPECTNEVQPRADEPTQPHSALASASEQETETQQAIDVADTIMIEDSDSDESEIWLRPGYNIDELTEEDWAIIDGFLNMLNTTNFVYWCLLLEPVGEGKYTRVGMAMLYPHAVEALGAEDAEFEII